jgi:hypothetical protein
LEQKIDLNADGSRQKIADRHSCAVASVEKQRIARLELTLHSVAASNGTGIAVGDWATEFSGVDENVYAALCGCATQLGEQFMSEVLLKPWHPQTDYAPNPHR